MAKEDTSLSPTIRPRGGVIAASIIGGLVLLGIAFIIGVAAGRLPNQYGLGAHRVGGYMMRGGEMGMWHGGDSTSGLSRFSGTVTAVNGSDFTLAGGGSTVNVKTSGSTQWHGGNAVKVNDSAIAFGTLSGGDFTANVVSINP